MLLSTIGLNTPGVTVAVWRFNRFASDQLPNGFHLVGAGLDGRFEGTQSFDRLLGSENIIISPGFSFYVPPGQAVLSSGSGQVACIHIMIDTDVVDETLRDLIEEKISSTALKGFNHLALPRINALSLDIFRELTMAEIGFERVITGMSKLLAVELAREQIKLTRNKKEMKPDSLSGEIVEKIIDEIEHNLDGNLEADAFASSIGIGTELAQIGFRATTGIGIDDYIMSARLNRAFFRLAYESATIDDVAKQTGFEDAAGLNAAFARHFRYSADDVRNMN